jgi:tRNA(adenine34) deaminase
MIDRDWLIREAISEARKADALGEVPIGAVILHVPTGKIIARGHNLRETQKDPTAHAEIVALRQAARELNSWRILDSVMAVTLEPCVMCAGALVNARLPTLVYGCDDPKAGAVRTLYQLCEDQRLNHRVEIVSHVLAGECAALLQAFFQKQRALGKK